MAIQDQVASAYLDQFDIPIDVAIMPKLAEFPMLQTLGFNGQLNDAKNTFHGLQDFYEQMATYSRTHWILQQAWSLIVGIVPNNAIVASRLYEDPDLGTVGNAFAQISGYGKAFGVQAGELQEPGAIRSQAEEQSG